ncbi:MAG: hypothetical protein PHD61_00310 [Bacteroidales bacterium]|nr:hypothetical protein [Bacteroidales bacterium]
MANLKHITDRLAPFVPGLVVFIFIYPFFSSVILDPGGYLLSARFDSIKNYYTYAYYIANSHNPLSFGGMNYPYGEMVFYLDNQPILSFLFLVLKRLIPGIENLAIPFLNLLITFSPVISAFVLFQVFKKLEVKALLSISASIGLSLLAPQFHRFASHLSLSYSFFIPTAIYLLIPDKKDNRIITRHDHLLSAFILLGFLLHAYLGMIIAFLSGFYFLFRVLVDFRLDSLRVYFFKGLVVTVVPAVLFFLLITLTDTHTGRSTDPLGFFTYRASFYSVFFQCKPFALLKVSVSPGWEAWEGWAYIGILSAVFIVPALIMVLVMRLGKQSSETQRFLLALGAAGVIALAFSCAFPFNLGLQHWVDAFPLFKIFRSIGRFAWIFYYVSGILTIWFLNLVFKNKFLLPVVVLLPLLYAIEAFPTYQSYSKYTRMTPNLFNISKVDKGQKDIIDEIKKSEFQAIIPLPFYHIGSENFGKSSTGKIYKESMIISYHTKLPLFSCNLSRTSIWESKNIMQLLAPPYYDKPIRNDLHNRKDLLIYWNNDPVNSYETDLIARSKHLFTNEAGSLYRISVGDMFDLNMIPVFELFQEEKASLHFLDNHFVDSTDIPFYYKDFDSRIRDTAFFGAGAYYGRNKNYNLLATLDSGFLKPGNTYKLTYWKYNRGPNYGQGVLNPLGIVSENGIWIAKTAPKFSPVINDDWTLFELEFQPQLINSQIQIYEVDYSKTQKELPDIIDELLIYQKGETLYREITDPHGEIIGVFKNNHPIMKNNQSYKRSSKQKNETIQ